MSQASAAAPNQAQVFLALGIALQLGNRLDDARQALIRAIEIDRNYALAFNSLAMTQKLAGALEKAVHNYDAGCKALARNIVAGLRNERGSLILKHHDTRGHLWLEHAMYGALHLVANQDGLSGIAWPTGESAIEEERTEKHGGLYWEDFVDAKGDSFRRFLPNYFNTFRETLRRDPTYSCLIGNRSTVLELLGRDSEAREHRDESFEFLPVAR